MDQWQGVTIMCYVLHYYFISFHYLHKKQELEYKLDVGFVIKIQEYIRRNSPQRWTVSEYLGQQKPSDDEEEEDKPLHGMYHWLIEVADAKKSYQWLEKPGLKAHMERHNQMTDIAYRYIWVVMAKQQEKAVVKNWNDRRYGGSWAAH